MNTETTQLNDGAISAKPMLADVKNGGFSAEVEKYTAANSNFQPERNYISLSHIHLSAEEIINQFKEGFEDSIPVRLKCYKGYQMERDLMERIKAVWGARIKTDIEVSAFDGLVKGHPDFTFDDYPSDCKSVLMDDWFPKDGKLPRRIYWQMQAYMKYSGKDKALVIFESRESGKLIDYWVRANWNIQKEIDEKLQQIVKAVS